MCAINRFASCGCTGLGVLGVLPGMVGVIQATEAIKLITGVGQSLAGRLLLIDALTMQFRNIRIRRDPACAMCATRTITALVDYDAFCGTPKPLDEGNAVPEITPRELAERLRRGDDLDLIDVREPYEWDAGHIDGAVLVPLGTLDSALATLVATREIVVMCRSGARSANAARRLHTAGFARVSNLAGGILRWSADVDS